MGYTHYFYTKEFTDEDKTGWKKALPIVKDILTRHANLIQYESDNRRKPVANQKMIRFNGIGEEGHETFLINAEKEQNDWGSDPTFAFCKTARKPYDIVVCEVLLALNAFLPNLKISSDGFSGYVNDQQDGLKLDGSWDQAIENVKRYGVHYHAEIEGTHGGEPGEDDPYCSFKLVLEEPARV